MRDPASIDPEINAWSFGALALSLVVHAGVANLGASVEVERLGG